MSIAKVDVDVKMSVLLMFKYLETRRAMLERLGYTYRGVNVQITHKGYHFWFKIKEKLTDKELAELQFLLGDDQVRCRFNFLRLDLGVFSRFNCLFSRKKKAPMETEGTTERR